jgi:hypothetical protein
MSHDQAISDVFIHPYAFFIFFIASPHSPPPRSVFFRCEISPKYDFLKKWEYLLFSSNFSIFGKEKLGKKIRHIWTLILV